MFGVLLPVSIFSFPHLIIFNLYSSLICKEMFIYYLTKLCSQYKAYIGLQPKQD